MNDCEFTNKRKVSEMPLCLYVCNRFILFDDDAIMSVTDINGEVQSFPARRIDGVHFLRPDYADYINSGVWGRRREKYFSNHPRVCYFCGSKENIQLHHLTYDNLGSELDDDLEPLCVECHKKLHLLADVVGENKTIDSLMKNIYLIGEIIGGHKPHIARVIRETLKLDLSQNDIIPLLQSKKRKL